MGTNRGLRWLWVLTVGFGLACGEDSTGPDLPNQEDIPWNLLSGHLVYVGSRGRALILFDAGNREVRLIAVGPLGSFHAPALSPELDEVVTHQFALDGNAYDLMSIPIGGGTLQCPLAERCGDPLVATPEQELGPAWFTDGRLAFQGNRHVDGSFVIGAVFVDGILAHDPVWYVASLDRPAWAPDGMLVAGLTRRGPDRMSGLYRIDPDTKEMELILEDELASRPAVSPDGTRIAYVRWPAESSGPMVHVVNIDGSGDRFLVEGDDPTWSPDGEWIAFGAHSEGAFPDLYLVAADGGQPIFIAEGGQPSWRE